MWEVVELLLSRPGLAVHPEDQQSQTSDAAEERVMRKMASATNQNFLSIRKRLCVAYLLCGTITIGDAQTHSCQPPCSGFALTLMRTTCTRYARCCSPTHSPT
jgi:hypothetical protein